MLINIPDEVANQLETLARERGVAVGELLQTLMTHYAAPAGYASLADLAQTARDAGIASAQPVDTAAKSREILKTEYADYLKRRANDDSNRH